MSTVSEAEIVPTVADLIDRLGGIAPRRILLRPLPGTASESDLLHHLQRSGKLAELVEGTLVEKAMGFRESILAGWLLHLLHLFLTENDLGEVTGPDGTMRLMAGLVRIPDVAFIRREKFPGGRLPEEPIPDLVPDLAIEVISESNTAGEMQRKLKEYFLAGTHLVWLVDPATRTVAVHTDPDSKQILTEDDTLDGGTVLPGLTLPVRRVFERLPPVQTPAGSGRRKKSQG